MEHTHQNQLWKNCLFQRQVITLFSLQYITMGPAGRAGTCMVWYRGLSRGQQLCLSSLDQRQTRDSNSDDFAPCLVFLLPFYTPPEVSSINSKRISNSYLYWKNLSISVTELQDSEYTVFSLAIVCAVIEFFWVEEMELSEGLILINHDVLFHENSSYNAVVITATGPYKI